MTNIVLKTINFLNIGGFKDYLDSLSNSIKRLTLELEFTEKESINLKKSLEKITCENDNLKENIISFKEEANNLKQEKESILSNVYKYVIKQMDDILKDETKVNDLYKLARSLDDDGYKELSIVREKIKGDIYSTFYYEDNQGLFEFMNGYQLINYYEKMEFGDIISSEFYGVYEKCEYSDPAKNERYAKYRESVKVKLIKIMIKKYPHIFLSKI